MDSRVNLSEIDAFDFANIFNNNQSLIEKINASMRSK